MASSLRKKGSVHNGLSVNTDDVENKMEHIHFNVGSQDYGQRDQKKMKSLKERTRDVSPQPLGTNGVDLEKLKKIGKMSMVDLKQITLEEIMDEDKFD